VSTHECADVFQAIGDEVARTWARTGFRDEDFPAIATDVLARAAVARHVSARDVLRYVIETPTLPFQQNDGSRFGEPPVGVYWHPRFYVEALFWLTGTATAHNHAFAGAFAVLDGQCIHTEYAFTLEEEHPDEIAFGAIALTDSALHATGHVETIEPGDAFVHAVFHVGRPSASLVVRTHSKSVGAGRQYIPPGLRVGPAFEDQLSRRRLQALGLLLQLASADYESAARQVMDAGGLRTAFNVLQQLTDLAPLSPMRAPIVAHATTRWGASIDRIERALAVQQRQRLGMMARRRVQRSDDLLLLGLLLLEENWRAIGDRLRQWAMAGSADEAAAWLAAGLDRLAACGAWGVALDADVRQAVIASAREAVAERASDAREPAPVPVPVQGQVQGQGPRRAHADILIGPFCARTSEPVVS